jgi:hypothetical protein
LAESDPRRGIANVPAVASLRSVSGAKPARSTSVRHIQAPDRARRIKAIAHASPTRALRRLRDLDDADP